MEWNQWPGVSNTTYYDDEGILHDRAKYRDDYVSEHDYMEECDCRNYKERLIEEYETEETAEFGEWVSCEKRLPTKRDEYVCTVECTKQGKPLRFLEVLELDLDVWIDEYDADCYEVYGVWCLYPLEKEGYENITVTAWMPYPALFGETA